MNYDAIAKEFDSFVQTAITEWRLGYPFVSKTIDKNVRTKILDFGCGSGVFSEFLSSNRVDVTGIDNSGEMLAIAKARSGAKAEYRTSLDGLKHSTFDTVTATFVLCTMHTNIEVAESLTALYRLLKPGGKLIILHSNWDRSNGADFVSFKLNKAELAEGAPITVTLKSDPVTEVHDFFRPLETYLRLLAEAGFTRAQVQEPLAADTSLEWLDETKTPPFYILSAVKV